MNFNTLEGQVQIEERVKNYHAAFTFLGINRKRHQSLVRLLPKDVCIMITKMIFPEHPKVKCLPNDNSVQELVNLYPGIKYIDLTNMSEGQITKITDRALQVLGGCQQLRSINLGYTNLLRSQRDCSIEGLKAMIQKLPNLKEYKGFSNNDILVALATHCRGLTLLELDEKGYDPMTDDVFERVLPQLNNIRKIIFNGVSHITNKTLYALARNCPKLESVTMAGCNHISDKGVIELIEKCNGIKDLDFICGIGDEALNAVNKNLADLRRFSLAGCEMSDESILNFAKTHPQLTHLTLYSLTISEETLLTFANYCHELVEINIENKCMTEKSCEALIKNCPHLKRCKTTYTKWNKSVLKGKYPHIEFD